MAAIIIIESFDKTLIDIIEYCKKNGVKNIKLSPNYSKLSAKYISNETIDLVKKLNELLDLPYTEICNTRAIPYSSFLKKMNKDREPKPKKKDLDQKIKDLIDKDKSYKEIAKELDINPLTIYKHNGKEPKKRNKVTKRVSEDDDREIRKMRDEGMSIKDIAKETGFSYTTVRLKLKE